MRWSRSTQKGRRGSLGSETVSKDPRGEARPRQIPRRRPMWAEGRLGYSLIPGTERKLQRPEQQTRGESRCEGQILLDPVAVARLGSSEEEVEP